MKKTKQAPLQTFSRGAAARGKFWSVCLLLLLIITAAFCAHAPQAQALEQNAQGVYELRTAQDLKDFRDLVNGEQGAPGNVGADAKLMADIDLGGEPWTPIGIGPYPNAYEGTFDGGGFTVRGVKVENGVEIPGAGSSVGFFGFIYGSVKNLNIIGEISAESSGDIYIGGVAGRIQFDSYVPDGAKILNCSFSGNVSANSAEESVFAGGIAGQTMGGAADSRALVSGCVYTGGSVTSVCGGQNSNNSAGGVVGQAGSNTFIYNCASTSEKISASGAENVSVNSAGGIAGKVDNAEISSCSAASAAISAEGAKDNNAGGITGSVFSGKVSGCAYTAEPAA